MRRNGSVFFTKLKRIKIQNMSQPFSIIIVFATFAVLIFCNNLLQLSKQVKEKDIDKISKTLKQMAWLTFICFTVVLIYLILKL